MSISVLDGIPVGKRGEKCGRASASVDSGNILYNRTAVRRLPCLLCSVAGPRQAPLDARPDREGSPNGRPKSDSARDP